MPATTNRDAFTIARQRLAEAPRTALSAVAADLVAGTPVKTGQLRASWTASAGAAAIDAAPAAPDPGGTATVERLQAEIAAVPDGAEVSFTNAAPYALPVEFGTAKMAPRAFTRTTMARAPVLAAEALARDVTP